MKKIVLLAISFSAFAWGASAQWKVESNQRNLRGQEMNPDLYKKMEQERRDYVAKYTHTGKVAGGPVSTLLSHTDAMYSLWGGTSTFSGFIDPMFPDSLVIQDFGTPENVGTHAIGATLDVTSPNFGTSQFSPIDAYTLDTIVFWGIYDMPMGSPMNDSLVIEVVVAPKATNNSFRSIFLAPDAVNDTSYFYAMNYMGGTAHGLVGGLTDANKQVFSRAFSVSDTGNDRYTFPVNISVGADELVGFLFYYKPGYSYNAGDLYFIGSGGTGTATINSFRGVLYQETQFGNPPQRYFHEEDYWGISQTVGTVGRYGTSTNTLVNEIAIPTGTEGYWIDFHVTGNSSVSIDELDQEISFAVYPNPSNGLVNILFQEAEKGAYTVSLMNVLGQEVFNEDITVDSSTENRSFNFSHLEKGIYLLNVSHGSVNTVKRVTIK